MGSYRRLGALALAAGAVFSCSPIASADPLFSDPGESLTNYTIVQDARTTANSIDYGALGIPEAPGTVANSTQAKTGIQLTANKGAGTATVTGLNLVLGSTPQTFSGVHTLEFYVWMNVPSGASFTTEDFVAGVARSSASAAIYGNWRSSRGNGAWTLLSGDNNLTTDYRQLNNGSADVGYGDENANLSGKLNAAFTNDLGGLRNEAANEWVKVDIVLDPTAATPTASVYMNDVLFSSDTSTNTSGYAWFGYEDPASSIGTDGISGIFDNVQVLPGNAVPEPTSLAAVVLGGLALIGGRRRRHA